MPNAKAPIPTASHSVEREYYRNLLRYHAYYAKLLQEGLDDLLPKLRQQVSTTTPQALAQAHMDAGAPDELDALFQIIRNKLRKAFPDSTLRKWSRAMTNGAHNLSAKNQAKHFKHASRGEIEVLGILDNRKKLEPYFQNVLDQNVSLIRSVAEEKMPALRSSLVNAVTQDMHASQFAKIIQKNLGATKSKAKLIATDQVGKLNGALDEYQQRLLGVAKYYWRTMKDGCVRPGHKKLEGTLQRWDKAPIENPVTGSRGHPKQPVRCRCWAEAFLDDVLEK